MTRGGGSGAKRWKRNPGLFCSLKANLYYHSPNTLSAGCDVNSLIIEKGTCSAVPSPLPLPLKNVSTVRRFGLLNHVSCYIAFDTKAGATRFHSFAGVLSLVVTRRANVICQSWLLIEPHKPHVDKPCILMFHCSCFYFRIVNQIKYIQSNHTEKGTHYGW